MAGQHTRRVVSTVALCQRPFSGESDLQAMMALARATAMANLHVADLPYRLSSWALDDPDSVGLWADYQSIGFQPMRHVLAYRKDYGHAQG